MACLDYFNDSCIYDFDASSHLMRKCKEHPEAAIGGMCKGILWGRCLCVSLLRLGPSRLTHIDTDTH